MRVCIDLDAGYRTLGGRIAIGAKRSPVHTPAQAAALARAILAREGVRLVGIMAYEAQIAGLGDAPGGRGIGPRLRGLAIRALQSLSARELAVRRARGGRRRARARAAGARQRRRHRQPRTSPRASPPSPS